jgi:hypothetical protein
VRPTKHTIGGGAPISVLVHGCPSLEFLERNVLVGAMATAAVEMHCYCLRSLQLHIAKGVRNDGTYVI